MQKLQERHDENNGKGRAVKIALSVILTVLILSAAFCMSAYSNNMFGIKDYVAGESSAVETGVGTTPDIENVNAVDAGILPDINAMPGTELHSAKGAWLVPGADYLKSEADAYETQTAAINSCLDKMVEYGFNTVIVQVNQGSKVIYKTSAAQQYYSENGDLLQYIIDGAKQRGLLIYGNINLNSLSDGGLDMFNKSHVDIMCSAVKDLCAYELDGLMLSDYTLIDKERAYNDYLLHGGGMGFEKYKNECISDAVLSVVKSVRRAKSSMYLGLYASSIWAEAGHAEGGYPSETYLPEAYTDNNADTLGWLKDGLFNFVIIDNGESTEGTPSFDSIAQWWVSALNDSGVDVYISHAAHKAGSGAPGWKSPDQLTKQAMALSSMNVNGSFFNSISWLTSDTSGSTNALTGYLKGTINSDYIMNELVITSPKKTSITTYENKINIIGSSDPNFPLTLNGNNVERTENGYFSLEINLSLGENKFTFEHKGKSVTYKVNYLVVVIKDVSPSSDMSFDGGTTISFGVSALDGASVTATFNGDTINLNKQQQQVDEENQNIESSYTVYTGQVTLPEGKTSAQDLGKVVFKATYKGISDKVTGGRITVNALPQQPSSSPGSGIPPYVTVGNQYIAEVVTDQAETFRGGTADDYSRADNFPLPKGTLDYCGETEIVAMNPGSSALHYRQMRYGKRVYTKSSNQGDVVKVYKGTLPESNTVTASKVNIQEKRSEITFDVAWKAPFDIVLSPQSYSNPNNENGRPEFAVSSLTYTYVDINFYYASTAQGSIDLTGSRVFTSAEWISNNGYYTLRLHLSKPGGFYGYSAEYNSSGQLVFSFLHPAKVNTAGGAGSLNGVNIVIDAGHGGSDGGASGSIANLHEAQLNLIMSQKIEQKLKALGANVIMTRTGDTYLSLEGRNVVTRNTDPDIFVSVHRNSATSSSAKGYENFYFYPFSMPLAQNVFDSVGATGHLTMRSVKYYPYYVTRVTECPSILTENGFVSTASEYEKLITDASNETLAQATVDGIVKYFNSIQ